MASPSTQPVLHLRTDPADDASLEPETKRSKPIETGRRISWSDRTTSCTVRPTPTTATYTPFSIRDILSRVRPPPSAVRPTPCTISPVAIRLRPTPCAFAPTPTIRPTPPAIPYTPFTIRHILSTVRPTPITHTPVTVQDAPPTIPHTSITAREHVTSAMSSVQRAHTDHRTDSGTTSTQLGQHEQDFYQTSLREDRFPSERPPVCLPIMTDMTQARSSQWSSLSTNYFSVLLEPSSSNFHRAHNHGEDSEESVMRSWSQSSHPANTAMIPQSLVFNHARPSYDIGVLPRDKDERNRVMMDVTRNQAAGNNTDRDESNRLMMDVTCNQTAGNNTDRDERNRLMMAVTCNQTAGNNTDRDERNRLLMDVTCNQTAGNNTHSSCSYGSLSTCHSQDDIDRHERFRARHNGTLSPSTPMEHDGNMDPSCCAQSSDPTSGLQLSTVTIYIEDSDLLTRMTKNDISSTENASDELADGLFVSKEQRFTPSSEFGTSTKNSKIQNGAYPDNIDSFSAACHQSTQSKRRPVKCYMCETCSKSFSQARYLKRHIRIHSGEKPYTCNDCPAAFAQSCNLKNHMKIHNEKQYECEVCHTKFAQPQGLKRHMRTHTGEKPYECEVCHATFANSSNFKYHMAIHTGRKPYGCQECPATFGQHSPLIRHMKVHKGDRPLKCDKCTASFSVSQWLTLHGQIHR